MNKLPFWFLTAVMLLSGRIEATRARSDALGLEGRYWMLERQLPYLFENPAVLFSFANTAYVEYDGSVAEGGFIFSGKNAGIGIFSGRPANDGQLNSALAPVGMYHTGGDKFAPLVATGSGLTLDAAATDSSAGFGNLDGRVSRLDDPGDNRLRQKNIGIIFAAGNQKNAFGLLWEYGVASDAEKYDGLGRENLSLRKSQTTLGLGFVSAPGRIWKLLDGSLRVNYFNIENRYEGRGVSGENLSASFGSSGAYDLSAALRMGFRLSEQATVYPRLGATLMDYSSQATAKAAGGVLSPGFDLQDTCSRTGYRGSAGFAIRRAMPANAFLLAAVDAEYMFLESYYDSRDYGNNLYSEYPLQTQAEYFRMPVIVGFEANLSEFWQLRLSIKHPLLALPEQGYAVRETGQYRSDNSYPDITYSETTGRIIQSGSTSLAMGFSYRVAGFTVDWLTSVALLRRGPNFISGAEEALAARIGITYNFNYLLSGETDEKK